MRTVIVRRLEEIGCPKQHGGLGYDPSRKFATYNPIIAIWDESEDPTEEEIEILKQTAVLLVERANFHNLIPSPYQEFYFQGVNTVTFYKLGGLWTFRRLFWEGAQKWNPVWRSLEDLVADI